MKVWAVSLLTMELSPHSLTADEYKVGIRSLVGESGRTQDNPSSALPPTYSFDASPKAISGRTSYFQARLAFHFLPQLIPEYCTAHGFGPPLGFHRDSPWPWQARLTSGPSHFLSRTRRGALLTLGFPMPPPRKGLDRESARTRWLILQ